MRKCWEKSNIMKRKSKYIKITAKFLSKLLEKSEGYIYNFFSNNKLSIKNESDIIYIIKNFSKK